MKRNFRFISLLLVIFLIISCKQVNVQRYTLTIVTNENLGTSSLDEPLNSQIRTLCNLTQDTGFQNIIFVPEITLIRSDYVPEKSGKFNVPLSQSNQLLNNLKMPISGTNLMQDYSENIPNLKTPEILCYKTGIPLQLNELKSKYKDAEFLTFDDNINNKIDSIRIKITTLVGRGLNNKFTVVLLKESDENLVYDTVKIPPPPTKEKVIQLQGKGVGTPPPPPPPPPHPLKCKNQIIPGVNYDVQDYFAIVGNKSIDNACKLKLKSYLYNYFTTDAVVITVTNRCNNGITLSPDELYENMLGSGNKLFIQAQCENVKQGEKYSKLSIQIGR